MVTISELALVLLLGLGPQASSAPAAAPAPAKKAPSVAALAMKKIATTCGKDAECTRNEKAALDSMAVRRVRTPGEAWVRKKCATEANQTFAIQDACEAALMPAAPEIDRLLRSQREGR